jgi:hypothetical protein
MQCRSTACSIPPDEEEEVEEEEDIQAVECLFSINNPLPRAAGA